MGEKIRVKYHLSFEDTTIFSCYLEAKENRLLFGFIIPDHDIHLTVLFNQEKNLLQPHITDTKPRSGFRQQPWGQHTDLALVLDEITRRLNAWVKPYHHNQRGWKMTPRLKERLQESVFPKERQTGEWEVPFITEMELPPFANTTYWERTRLRDMVGKAEIVIVEGQRVDWLVIVLDNRKMMRFSDQQFDKLADYIFDTFGIEEYLKYVAKRVPKKKFINF